MRLFIFGSTGDLVRHKVIAGLEKSRIKNLEVFAIGRRNITREEYIKLACKNCSKSFKKKINYIVCELDESCFLNNLTPLLKKEDIKNFTPLLKKEDINFFYIALPPHLLKHLISYLSCFKKKGFKIKILMEKPFGENLKDAIKLKRIIKKNNMEDDIFISDHYLFKTTVKNIKYKDFKEIKMVSLEKVGLKGRTEYYDRVGALGDMVQNHFLNIIFKIIKNPEKEFKNFKIIKYERGQYGNGKNTGYIKELGRKSNTETFVHLIIETKKRKYEFMTGKAFDEKISFIEIDKKRINLNTSENPYSGIFRDFFSFKKENFPTMENSILAWKIISKIKKIKKPKLNYYKENTSSELVLKTLSPWGNIKNGRPVDGRINKGKTNYKESRDEDNRY